ncbi:MAG: TIGR01212 family radical SAM protein [Oscillospiraceae bacterium]
MFIYSDTNKRYHTFDYHLKHKFSSKVFKVSLNAGFTCPNIDGSKGYGGCTYCSSLGSGDFGGSPNLSLKDQFDEIKSNVHNKWPDAKYIAYFQANTNTYAPIETLKLIFEEVLTYKNVVGISIATRADCIPDEVADYLMDLSKRTFLIVELGLQTINDDIGEKINRCHSYGDFLTGFNKLKSRDINVCVHIINGLPNETKEMMLDTINAVAKLNVHSVKLHLLHVIKGTKMAEQYQNNEFELLSLENYINIICDQIERLPKEVVIQRITGDGDKNTLIGPLWSTNKLVVMNSIDKELVRRNSYQGIKFNNV